MGFAHIQIGPNRALFGVSLAKTVCWKGFFLLPDPEKTDQNPVLLDPVPDSPIIAPHYVSWHYCCFHTKINGSSSIGSSSILD